MIDYYLLMQQFHYFVKIFLQAKVDLLSTKYLQLLKTTINNSVTDMQRCTATRVVPAKEKAAIAFDSWKGRHYFEIIRSKSNKLVVRCLLHVRCFQLQIYRRQTS